MAKPRGLNRFFSPRVQGQFIPQFVEDEFPFEEAFLVGSGAQQRIDDLVAQATELGQTEVRPLESDIQEREQAMGELQAGVEDILSSKGGLGEMNQAAGELSGLLARTRQKDFFKFAPANVELFEQGEKRRAKFDDPLTRQGDIFTEPMRDPETGRLRVLSAADVVETPDFDKVIRDNFGDLEAAVTQGNLVPSGVEGILKSETETILTPEDIREHSKNVAEAFLSTEVGEDFALSAIQRGVDPNGLLQAAEERIFNILRDEAQSKKTITFRNVPKVEEGPEADPHAGMGIGKNISAIITPGEGTDRLVSSVGEIVKDPDTKEDVTIGGGEMTLKSEKEFVIRDKNGKPMTLQVSPQWQWNLNEFDEAEANPGEELFSINVVQDFMFVKKDIPELGIKKDRPIPEEQIETLLSAVVGRNVTEEERQEIAPRGTRGLLIALSTLATATPNPVLATIIAKRKKEISELPEDEQVKLLSPEDFGRELFATGILKGEEDKSIVIPYRFIKNSIQTATSAGPGGGFVINEREFFKEAPESLFIGEDSFTVEELRNAGWSDDQIQQLRDQQ